MFISTVGQLLELVRKLILEDDLETVRVLFKQYVDKLLMAHPLVSKIEDESSTWKDLRAPLLSLQPMLLKSQVSAEYAKSLIIHLRELQRYSGFLSLYDHFSDLTQQYPRKAEILNKELYRQSLVSLENKCMTLIAHQPVTGHVHQILFSDPSDTPLELPGVRDLSHQGSELNQLRKLQLVKINKMLGAYVLKVLGDVLLRKEAHGCQPAKGDALPWRLVSSCLLGQVDSYAYSVLTQFNGVSDALSLVSSQLRP